MSSKFVPVDHTVLTHIPSKNQPLPTNLAQDPLSKDARDTLLSVDGVLGYGFASNNQLIVYMRTDCDTRQIPNTLEGLKVKIERITDIQTFTEVP